MSSLMLIPLAWLLAVNGLAIGAFRADKIRAERKDQRTPENELLQWVWLGGAPGAWWAMRAFRHKTRKESFRRRFRTIVILQTVVVFGALVIWIAFGEVIAASFGG